MYDNIISEEVDMNEKNEDKAGVNEEHVDCSYWEYVDALHSMQNSNSSVKHSASSSDQAILKRTMPMLDQFHPCIHDSIENIVDIKADGNCGYRAIDALLDMGEDSWSLARNHFFKKLTK